MTLVFETDSNTSKDHTGFRIEWDVYDRPDPTPPPPSNSESSNLPHFTIPTHLNNLLHQSTTSTHPSRQLYPLPHKPTTPTNHTRLTCQFSASKRFTTMDK